VTHTLTPGWYVMRPGTDVPLAGPFGLWEDAEERAMAFEAEQVEGEVAFVNAFGEPEDDENRPTFTPSDFGIPENYTSTTNA
jgi:hypothetical protein